MYARLIVTSLAMLLLAGCASVPNPFSSPTQAAAVPAPSAAPAPVTAGIATSRDPRVADLTAAGVKPLALGAVGSYMDHEEADLRAQLGSSGISINRVGQQIVITLPAHLTFDSDKAAVKPQFAGTVKTIGQVLEKYGETVIDVYGYTDDQGLESSNRDMSQRRAVSVATLLTSQGVDQRRFFIEGRGSLSPVASNDNEVGRARNRRVEIQISPLAAGQA